MFKCGQVKAVMILCCTPPLRSIHNIYIALIILSLHAYVAP